MAVDQALLSMANEVGLMTLRFYRWSQPTLSLGYFQKSADRKKHRASLSCAMVRRASGGGAILHDQELTYSLCIPSTSRWSLQNSALYTMVHQGIIQLLSNRGVQATLYDPSTDEQPLDKAAFLCFQRRTTGDIILHRHKVVGSAQRRSKNAVLQHGSLLLRQSEFAPGLPGVDDLVGVETNVNELIDGLAQFLCLRLGKVAESAELEKQEIDLAREIENSRFASSSWNLNR